MGKNTSQNLSSLDKIRLQQGTDQLKLMFHQLAENQQQQAVLQLNEEILYFPSLFILMPEIKALHLYEKLNARNIAALKACDKIIQNENSFAISDLLSAENRDLYYPALKWILQTGIAEDGLSNEYDKVLDGSASLLIKTFQDQTSLPIVINLIFTRNRKGHLIHDLVWCLFQIRSPYTLNLIAGYLRSDNPQDAKLARKLLHFVPSQENARSAVPHNQYEAYLSWLKENYPYLYFTGESLQFSSEPEPWSVDLEAKYLCKGISPTSRKPLTPLTDFEQNCLHHFHEAGEDEKKLLSKYSNKIHSQNVGTWSKWMEYDLDKQIQIAKGGLGGVR